MVISKDLSDLTLKINFESVTPAEFSLNKCSCAIRDHLALHGAIQMIFDAANKDKVCEWAYRNANDKIAYIYEQYPESLSIKTPRNLIIEAISRIKDYSIEETTAIWNQLLPEKRKSLAKHHRVKSYIEVIRGERAKFKLDRLNDAHGNQRKLYEHDFDFENRKAHIRFINDSKLEIDLALVNDVNSLALYGAEQKIKDSYSGIQNDLEKKAQAERVIHNLYENIWSSKKGGVKQDAEYSFRDKQIAEQLADWMLWKVNNTMLAIAHIEKKERLMLMSNEAKILLTHYSKKLGMDSNPGRCNQREIANLLDEVIYRLIPQDD